MEKTKYWLPTIFDGTFSETLEYKKLKRIIDTKGFFSVKVETDNINVCIYNPVLALIFISKDFFAQTMLPCVDTNIDGGKFLTSYIEGYKKGIEYFNDNYKPTPVVLYGENSKQYVESVQKLYAKSLEGANCGNIKTDIPSIISNHIIAQNYGYYSGIVSKVEELANRHPSLFTNESDRGTPQPQQSTKAKGFDSKISAEQISKLVPHLNLAELFEKPIDEPTLISLFNGSLENPLKLNNNRLLAYFLNKLKDECLITKRWQAAAESTNSFLSSGDKAIKSNDLSRALNELNSTGKPKNSEHIDTAISKL